MKLRDIVLQLPIDTPQLGLSVRCMNSLRNAFAQVRDTEKRPMHRDLPDNRFILIGHTFFVTPTVEDVLEYSDDKLMMVRNMGVKSVEEIRALRAELSTES